MMKYIIIIAVMSIVVYVNTLNNEFVSDDITAIAQRQDIGRLWPSNSPTTFVNKLCYRIGGYNPAPYHAANILIHMLNSILVFFFLRLFFEKRASFWGALIFAVHPIATESVTWISGKGYSLFTMFLLLSFLLYLAATNQKWGQFPLGTVPILAASVIFYLLALYTVYFAFFFPLMIVLYDVCFRDWKKNWKYWIAFFAVTGLKLKFLMGGEIEQRAADVTASVGGTTMTNPIFNAAFSIFSHLWLLVWPAKLTLYHEPVSISAAGLALELFLLAAPLLALPFIFKRSRRLFFSICIFILFLAPTYSPVMISWLVAERYAYFPVIAFCMWAAIIIERIGIRRIKKDKEGKIRIRDCFAPKVGTVLTENCPQVMTGKGGLVMALLIVLITAYATRTIIRNRDWRTHASVWRATVKVSPLSPKAHNNMGDVYSLEGNEEKAAAEFRRAIELKPDYADAYHNLALTYQRMGRLDEAVVNYEKAVLYNPRLWQSYQNLAVIYAQRGEAKKAREYWEKAQEVKEEKEK